MKAEAKDCLGQEGSGKPQWCFRWEWKDRRELSRQKGGESRLGQREEVLRSQIKEEVCS